MDTAKTPMTRYRGIDYGRGVSNIDTATGIRYGVISQHSINPDAFEDVWRESRDLTYESSVAEFKRDLANCEDTEELAELLDDRLFCRIPAKQWAEELTEDCTFPLSEHMGDIWSAIEDEFNDAYSMGDCGDRDWLYESDGYKLANCLTSDVFVLASPYFTYAQFCSPCVPGACNLDSPLHVNTDASEVHCLCRDHGVPRAYCLSHDWFDGGRAPYPVYSVATGELVSE